MQNRERTAQRYDDAVLQMKCGTVPLQLTQKQFVDLRVPVAERRTEIQTENRGTPFFRDIGIRTKEKKE